LLKKVGLAATPENTRGNVGGNAAAVAIGALPLRKNQALLMESHSALDAMTRAGIADEVLSPGRSQQATVIFVTHDLEEAIYLGDRVIVCCHISRPHRHRAQDRSAATARSADDAGRSGVSAAPDANCSISFKVRKHDPGARQSVPASGRGPLRCSRCGSCNQLKAILSRAKRRCRSTCRAFKDGSVLTATRDTRHRVCRELLIGGGRGLAFALLGVSYLRSADGVTSKRSVPSLHCAAADRPDRIGFRIPMEIVIVASPVFGRS